jgi:hypothetical protein
VKFWLGLAIGVALGAAAMYLGSSRPWRSPDDAPVAAPVPVDAGAAPGKRRKRPTRSGAATVDRGPIDDTIVLAAAEKRLEWRGDEVALPAQTVDMGAGGDARSLDAGEIRQTIDRDAGAMLECLTRSVGQAPLEATITLEVLVDPTGRVSKTRVRAPIYLFAQGLLPCARRAAQQLRFPGTGAYTVVTTPFELY